MSETKNNAETELQIFPWSEFITLLGFTIIFVIEIFQGSQNKNEYSLSSKGKTTSGTISITKIDLKPKLTKNSLKIFILINK